MSSDLRQSLVELESLFKEGKSSASSTSQKLGKLKVSQNFTGITVCDRCPCISADEQLELAQSGLYFAPPTGNPEDLAATSEQASLHTCRR
jgi:hypothetical protein